MMYQSDFQYDGKGKSNDEVISVITKDSPIPDVPKAYRMLWHEGRGDCVCDTDTIGFPNEMMLIEIDRICQQTTVFMLVFREGYEVSIIVK